MNEDFFVCMNSTYLYTSIKFQSSISSPNVMDTGYKALEHQTLYLNLNLHLSPTEICLKNQIYHYLAYHVSWLNSKIILDLRNFSKDKEELESIKEVVIWSWL